MVYTHIRIIWTLCSWIIKPNYLVVPLTYAAPQFPKKLNPVIHTLLITMPAAGARSKATKIYLIDCAWSRNLPKTQHTSYTKTLTLLKYFSGASHDSHFHTIWLVILYFYYFYIFLLFYVFPVYRVHVPFKAVFFLISVLCLKEIWSYELTFKRLTKMKYRMHKSNDWTAR